MPKVTKEGARESLPIELRPMFDMMVEETGYWSMYFYGTRMVSYAILAELVRDGWTKVTPQS